MGEFQFCKIKIVLEMDDDNGCTTLRMYLVPMNCSLKNGSDDKFCVLVH